MGAIDSPGSRLGLGLGLGLGFLTLRRTWWGWRRAIRINTIWLQLNLPFRPEDLDGFYKLFEIKVVPAIFISPFGTHHRIVEVVSDAQLSPGVVLVSIGMGEHSESDKHNESRETAS